MSYTTGIEINKKKVNHFTVAEALARVYLIKGGHGGYISVPTCLIGKK